MNGGKGQERIKRVLKARGISTKHRPPSLPPKPNHPHISELVTDMNTRYGRYAQQEPSKQIENIIGTLMPSIDINCDHNRLEYSRGNMYRMTKKGEIQCKFETFELYIDPAERVTPVPIDDIQGKDMKNMRSLATDRL